MDKQRIPQLKNQYTTYHLNSYGAIVYSKDTKSLLIVQRKHSYEYLLLLRGMYRPSYLTQYVANLHSNEIQSIIDILHYGDQILEKLYHQLNLNFYNFNFALCMFIRCKDILIQLLQKTPGKELTWSFPKGHNNTFETINDTIAREFMEEVGINIPEYTHISSNIIEDINTSLFNCTMHNYYVVYIVSHMFELPPIMNNIEVQNSKWISEQEISNYKLLNTKALYDLQCLLRQQTS